MSERIHYSSYSFIQVSSTRVKLKLKIWLESKIVRFQLCNSLNEIFISVIRAIVLINNDRRCKEGKAKDM